MVTGLLPHESRESQHSMSLDHLVAGTLAGCASTAGLYPLDLIKVRFQANHIEKRLPPITTAIRNIVRSEGWRALYSGMWPSLVGATIANGGFFFLYERAKARMRGDDGNGGSSTILSARHHVAASLQAGCILVLLTNPIWLMKTRLQLQCRRPGGVLLEGDYRGMVHGLSCVVREEGFLALYRGIVPALLLTSNGAVQFTVYEQLKALDPLGQLLVLCGSPLERPTFVAASAHGFAAKIVATCVTYPYQVVKTRVQTRSVESTGEFDRTRRQALAIWRNEGARGFFKGCWPNAVRVAPNAAMTFAVYEETMSMMRRLREAALI